MSTARSRRSPWHINALTASAGLAALIGILLAIDARVREQSVSLVNGRGFSGELGSSSVHVQNTIESAIRALHDQGLTYGALTMFGVAAVILTIVMFRT